MLLNKETPGVTSRRGGEQKPARKDLADTLQDALEAAMVEAIAGELKKPELANKKDESSHKKRFAAFNPKTERRTEAKYSTTDFRKAIGKKWESQSTSHAGLG